MGMGFEKAVVRKLSRIEARRLGLALLVGCCLVILIYFVSLSETTGELVIPALFFISLF